jgi:hypothetical protein
MKRMSGRYAALAAPGGRGAAAILQSHGNQTATRWWPKHYTGLVTVADCVLPSFPPSLPPSLPSLCVCVCVCVCVCISACAGAPLVPKSMGADEFLPIHMFVLVNARLENPQLLSRQLQQLCDESTIQVCGRRFNARACMVRLCIGL